MKAVSLSDFFIDCVDVELAVIASDASVYFERNILVSPDIKAHTITCNVRGLGLTKTLDLLAWLAGVEWYEREGDYFIGGNKDYIQVLPNTGIDKGVTSVFGGSSVRLVDDKIVVTGGEREVKRVSDAITQLQDKNYITVRVWGYEITDDQALKLGINIDESIKYAFSWENILENSYNPMQSLAVTLAASVERDRSGESGRLVLNTVVTCISGKQQTIIVGETFDRPTYAVSEYGNSYVSGYNTLQTGYQLRMSAYTYGEKDYVLDFKITNSNAQTELRRSTLNLENTVVLSDSAPALIGRIIKEQEVEVISNGIPLLADLPWIGYLFRVTEERKVRRNVIFFVERVKAEAPEAGATAPPGSAPLHLLDVSQWVKEHAQSFISSPPWNRSPAINTEQGVSLPEGFDKGSE